VTRGKIHQDWDVEVGDEVEQKILELVLFGSIERQLTEDNAGDLLEQSRGA